MDFRADYNRFEEKIKTVSNAFRLSGWVGCIVLEFYNFRYQTWSQTPFGFEGGLDSLLEKQFPLQKRAESQTPFGFRGGWIVKASKPHMRQSCKSQTPFGFRGGWIVCRRRKRRLGVLVSNAFRLWGWVGFTSERLHKARPTLGLKRLSALGVGWIIKIETIDDAKFYAESQTPFGFGGGLDMTGNKYSYDVCPASVSNAFRLWGWVGFNMRPSKQAFTL